MPQKKILMITPEFAYPPIGADNKDRIAGIKDFLRYGFEVEVIARFYEGSERKKEMEKLGQELGIKMFFVAYQTKRYLRRLLNPLYLDGAAFEYSRPEMRNTLELCLNNFHPDYVYFDYTFCWPLYHQVKKRKIPIITRSINFEAQHFLEESGYSFFNYFRFLPKLLTEFMTARKSDLIFSISPKEEKIYRKLGAKRVVNLPIRALPPYLDYEYQAKEKTPLNVFYSAANYKVSHNRQALEFLLREIAPEVNARFPQKFKFYFIGFKFPEEFKKYLSDHIIYRPIGSDEMEDFLSKMDIALSPSLSGCGMQQKIFEPLARGFPVITSKRGFADYPFLQNKEVLLAHTKEKFISAFETLLDYQTRKKLSEKAKEKAKQLFSQEKIDNAVLSSINKITK